MENKPKNREWVKTAAIIFLAVLLVLTFFSNTINNRLLPEVATVAVTDGSITAKVRATGKVSAIGNNEVKATGTRTVAAVKVKEGQEVNEGDVLFRKALATLFREENDPIEIIKWKDMYELLEDTLDAGEHLADTVEGIMAKYA